MAGETGRGTLDKGSGILIWLARALQRLSSVFVSRSPPGPPAFDLRLERRLRPLCKALARRGSRDYSQSQTILPFQGIHKKYRPHRPQGHESVDLRGRYYSLTPPAETSVSTADRLHRTYDFAGLSSFVLSPRSMRSIYWRPLGYR